MAATSSIRNDGKIKYTVIIKTGSLPEFANRQIQTHRLGYKSAFAVTTDGLAPSPFKQLIPSLPVSLPPLARVSI